MRHERFRDFAELIQGHSDDVVCNLIQRNANESQKVENLSYVILYDMPSDWWII